MCWGEAVYDHNMDIKQLCRNTQLLMGKITFLCTQIKYVAENYFPIYQNM